MGSPSEFKNYENQEWMRPSAMFTKGSKWLRILELWHFTATMLPAEVQDLLCPSSFHTLIMKLMFQHPSGKKKTYQRVCVGNLSCPIFLSSGNFISSSCSFKITPWNYCPFLCRAERPALNSQQKHGCGWDTCL